MLGRDRPPLFKRERDGHVASSPLPRAFRRKRKTGSALIAERVSSPLPRAFTRAFRRERETGSALIAGRFEPLPGALGKKRDGARVDAGTARRAGKAQGTGP